MSKAVIVGAISAIVAGAGLYFFLSSQSRSSASAKPPSSPSPSNTTDKKGKVSQPNAESNTSQGTSTAYTASSSKPQPSSPASSSMPPSPQKKPRSAHEHEPQEYPQGNKEIIRLRAEMKSGDSVGSLEGTDDGRCDSIEIAAQRLRSNAGEKPSRAFPIEPEVIAEAEKHREKKKSKALVLTPEEAAVVSGHMLAKSIEDDSEVNIPCLPSLLPRSDSIELSKEHLENSRGPIIEDVDGEAVIDQAKGPRKKGSKALLLDPSEEAILLAHKIHENGDDVSRIEGLIPSQSTLKRSDSLELLHKHHHGHNQVSMDEHIEIIEQAKEPRSRKTSKVLVLDPAEAAVVKAQHINDGDDDNADVHIDKSVLSRSDSITFAREHLGESAFEENEIHSDFVEDAPVRISNTSPKLSPLVKCPDFHKAPSPTRSHSFTPKEAVSSLELSAAALPSSKDASLKEVKSAIIFGVGGEGTSNLNQSASPARASPRFVVETKSPGKLSSPTSVSPSAVTPAKDPVPPAHGKNSDLPPAPTTFSQLKSPSATYFESPSASKSTSSTTFLRSFSDDSTCLYKLLDHCSLLITLPPDVELRYFVR
jgi:hypothetical protein